MLISRVTLTNKYLESNGDGNTKQIIYICMGVVAFVAHLTAFGITKFRNNLSSSSALNRGSKSGAFNFVFL